MAKLSNFADAMASPATHVFRAGLGYVDQGCAPAVKRPPSPDFPSGRCSPAGGTATGTQHTLIPPTGGTPMVFTWVGASRTWMPVALGGRRLGFTDDYLSQAGWTYSGPV